MEKYRYGLAKRYRLDGGQRLFTHLLGMECWSEIHGFICHYTRLLCQCEACKYSICCIISSSVDVWVRPNCTTHCKANGIGPTCRPSSYHSRLLSQLPRAGQENMSWDETTFYTAGGPLELWKCTFWVHHLGNRPETNAKCSLRHVNWS